jgi:hypothetical protein
MHILKISKIIFKNKIIPKRKPINMTNQNKYKNGENQRQRIKN